MTNEKMGSTAAAELIMGTWILGELLQSHMKADHLQDHNSLISNRGIF